MSNFAPLAPHQPDLAQIGADAERAFPGDPRAAMGHLRLFGERLSIWLLDLNRLPVFQESQHDRLKRLKYQSTLDPRVLDTLHLLRREGNKAVHAYGEANHRTAMQMLKAAHQLVRWVWHTYTPKSPPKPGPLVRPKAEDRRKEQALARAALDAERAARQKAESELDDVMRLLDMPQVATHSSIQPAFQRLEEAQKAVVSDFLQRFRSEPIHADWPLLTPDGMEDDKVRFVRAGELVVTVIQPARADLLLVVHVATEPDARAWAAHKRFEVNPTIGTLQVFDVVEAEAASAEFDGGLFDDVDDEALLAVGLPHALLGAVRAVSDEASLDALAPHVPPEAADGLYLLASGHSLEDTLAELGRGALPDEGVDTDDFAAAVHHPDSRRSFFVVDAPEDLEAILTGSVEAWRLYLHPDQRRLVQMKANGPVRVLGGAGTGKTVALLHRAKHLLESVFVGPDDHLLVTTYTKNLASDLSHHLDRLLTPDDRTRVEVHNLHALVARLWSDHGRKQRLANPSVVGAAWQEAMREESLRLNESFYREEWAQVVQANDVLTERRYMRVRRRGRGERFNRDKRHAAWRVFEAYRAALERRSAVEPADQMRHLRQGFEDGSIPRPFVAALVDEAQDFGAPELKFLRALVPEGPGDLFLVGDAHQRIYGHPVKMGRCGLNIVGRGRRLRVNYRTTAKVRDYAVQALLGESFDNLDGSTDSMTGSRSVRVGVEPSVHLLATAAAERAVVVETVQSWLKTAPPEALCVAAPTNTEVDKMNAALEDAGIQTTVIQSDASAQGAGVRCATFHRLKGLEFPRLVLTGIQKDRMPLRVRSFYDLDDAGRRTWDLRQRCLMYVAASRARDELVVTGFGKPSPFFSEADAEAQEEEPSKTCPKCGTTGPVASLFGMRRMRRTRGDGTEVVEVRAQSYCRSCRSQARRRR